ncbi:MAG: hypothetical protein KY445_04695 [Armatimonadetes bacterium]|nr:hypothetical protein [Armatimonadota bacterium]
MKTFMIPADESSERSIERQIRSFIRHWVGLLASDKYEDAVDLILPEIPGASGSVNSSEATERTPELLKAVITNYGTPEPWEGQDQTYKVVPIDDFLRKDFEAGLNIEFRPFEMLGKNYLGGIHVDLPLNYEEGNAVGDLTARFYFQRVSKDEMALVLHDIHML